MSHFKPLNCFLTEVNDTFFPIYNLPYGIFYTQHNPTARVGVAIGEYVLDLSQLEKNGLLPTSSPSLFQQDNLNVLASQGPTVWKTIRSRIQALLSSDNHELQDNKNLREKALIAKEEITLLLPFKIGGFTDFYASEHHASNVGTLFRGKENALMPNWKYLPVAYNGRASTVFLSGKNIIRPQGQIKLPNQEAPLFSPSRKLDFELEMGIFVGVGNPDGNPISVDQAKSHLFGLVLLNDWSARDIQAFEYQPLGPFLGKSFATSISPWVVTLDALHDCMTPLAEQFPRPVTYLQQHTRQQPDIKLKIELQTKQHSKKTTLSETNYKELYWTMEQMLAHHTVNGCIMQTGDLLGTGTISGPDRHTLGSLLEITFNGTQPIKLQDGSERSFLEEGDTVIMTGYAESPHYKIGFGEVRGTII